MAIGKVTQGDLPGIRALIASAIRHSVAESEQDAKFLLADIEDGLQAWASDPKGRVHLKYEREGLLLGVILVRDFWNLAHLFVAPIQQRQGIGRALVEAVIPECRSKSPKSKLMVNSSTVAVQFYKSLGFRQTGADINRPGGCVPLELSFD